MSGYWCHWRDKNDTGSDGHTLAYAWFLTLIATVVAGIAAPFYLVDACRTVAPKKPDKEQFFKNINVLPKPTSCVVLVQYHTDCQHNN
jgi:hypothetical protein